MAGAELRAWLACDWFVKYTAGLAQGLAENGCEVTLLTRDHDQEFGDEPGAMRGFVAANAGAVRHLELPGRVRDPGWPARDRAPRALLPQLCSRRRPPPGLGDQ